MTDKFTAAISEFAEALASGEDPNRALIEIADEHGLRVEALQNRAARALGDFVSYAERRTNSNVSLLKAERERSNWLRARNNLIFEAVQRGQNLSIADADSYIRFVGVEHAMRPSPYAITTATFAYEASPLPKEKFEPTPATFNTVPRPPWIKE
jgi:hypothetical protein